MRAYDVVLIGTLCRRFAIFMCLLQEHIDDYDALLPHVLMGDITRWIVQQFQNDHSDPMLREVFDFLEEEFEDAQGSDRELISASFLENLPRNGQDGSGIREVLGPALRDQLRRIG